MNLIQSGDFTLASGRKSKLKLECDALNLLDWQGIAAALLEILPPFRQVIGVPRGGLVLAECLAPYGVNESNVFLVVDDVWTTGLAWQRTAATVRTISDEDWGGQLEILGAVAFARGPRPSCVEALFDLNTKLWSK